MSKYRARRTTIDGIEFMSKKEAMRYEVLKAMQQSGEISDLQLQVKFDLLPTIKRESETLRKKSYIADFVYMQEGKRIVEDVKGFKTPIYSLKKHLLIYNNPGINFIET